MSENHVVDVTEMLATQLANGSRSVDPLVGPHAEWPENLSRDQAIYELKKRVELITDLRRHRDALLEALSVFCRPNNQIITPGKE
jgi:hypothetical protein